MAREHERSAMAFKIGRRGVPQHAIFRGVYEADDPGARTPPGGSEWGAPQYNNCTAAAAGAAAVGAGAIMGLEGAVNCRRCNAGVCKLCMQCARETEEDPVCARCWGEHGCLRPSGAQRDCRSCWAQP